MGNGHLNGVTNAPWGIVSIKPQDVDHELPMQVIQTLEYIYIADTSLLEVW